MITFFTVDTEVRLRLGRIRKEAGRLDHNLRADRSPVQLGRVALGENLDRLAIHRDRIGGVR